MIPRELPNGKLLIPRRAETGDVIGDGAIEIGPDDAEYDTWRRYLDAKSDEAPTPK